MLTWAITSNICADISFSACLSVQILAPLVFDLTDCPLKNAIAPGGGGGLSDVLIRDFIFLIKAVRNLVTVVGGGLEHTSNPPTSDSQILGLHVLAAMR